MSELVKAKIRTPLAPGDSVRVAREILNWSQTQLSEKCEIPQSTISGIESGRIALGVERAKKLARALGVHPSVLLFPQWELEPKRGATLRSRAGRNAS